MFLHTGLPHTKEKTILSYPEWQEIVKTMYIYQYSIKHIYDKIRKGIGITNLHLTT